MYKYFRIRLSGLGRIDAEREGFLYRIGERKLLELEASADKDLGRFGSVGIAFTFDEYGNEMVVESHPTV